MMRILTEKLTNLVYIDPPYSTGSSFVSRNRNHAYHDLMKVSDYL
jgi:adenine-specific DNA-methyltransferase